MKKYAALSPDKKNGTYLLSSDQMDKYLEMGWSIYEEENKIQTLIASPEDGFLIERPDYPPVITAKVRE